MSILGIVLLIFFLAVGTNLAVATLGGMITQKRGYGFARGFIMVVFIPLVGIITVLNLEDMTGKELFGASAGMTGINEREQDNIAKGVSKALEENNKSDKLK